MGRENVVQMSEEREQRTSGFLQPAQIAMIDEALRSLGEYGEVRLMVHKGRLRFLVTQRSFDVLKWQPGSLAEDLIPLD